jgi:beta-lactamase superfamily II metal-dependent hydrolase
MFEIHALPADHGDCLWIEYGSGKEIRRVLIDGGTQHSFTHLARKIGDAGGTALEFELFVITHIDADHIGGSLQLLREIDKFDQEIKFKDVWFNAWKHLKNDKLGVKQGELMAGNLEALNYPWNAAFGTDAVVVPDENALPVKNFDGGLRLTLFSPSRKKLDKLRDRWKEEMDAAKAKLAKTQVDAVKIGKSDKLGDGTLNVKELADEAFTGDQTVPNGSSIAFLAEFSDGAATKRCLFTGDAHVDMLISSIERMATMKDPRIVDGKLQIDLLKVSHHGSKNNISQDLLKLLDCPKYLFSTGGQQFKHPDKQGVARVIKYGQPSNGDDPELFFNYRSKYNEMWDDPGLKSAHYFKTTYPAPGTEGLVISL